MAVDDPPLECVGSNHVPGCEHYPEVPLLDPVATPLADRVRARSGLPPIAEELDNIRAAMDELPDLETVLAGSAVIGADVANGKDRTIVHIGAAGLTMNLEVAITRVGRRRCPRCRMLRVLFRLSAFSATQPVGYGVARCAACAGLR